MQIRVCSSHRGGCFSATFILLLVLGLFSERGFAAGLPSDILTTTTTTPPLLFVMLDNVVGVKNMHTSESCICQKSGETPQTLTLSKWTRVPWGVTVETARRARRSSTGMSTGMDAVKFSSAATIPDARAKISLTPLSESGWSCSSCTFSGFQESKGFWTFSAN